MSTTPALSDSQLQPPQSAPVQQGVQAQRKASLPQLNRIAWFLILFIMAVIGFTVYHKLRIPDPVATRIIPGNSVNAIYDDAAAYHLLWMRWTFTDWLLTFFAAGTAVSAAIKNAYSVRQEKQDKAGWFDITLMVLAVLAVLATTFDAKLHAAQLAEQYRAGDLILQNAEMTYAQSDKSDEAKAQLLKQWLTAQSILQQKYAPLKADDQPKPVAPPKADAQSTQGASIAQQGKNTQVTKTPDSKAQKP